MVNNKKTGSQALVATLANCGVTHCFANPGTSEMHLIQALDKEPRIHSVLCLFEGVASAAADGFARISGVPAITLLHLGPGYGNALANIHNARRAYSPMINIVGDHATYHRDLDAPLTSDIETIVKANSSWIGVAETALEAGEVAAKSFEAATNAPNSPVTLILPADTAWTDGGVDGPNVIAKSPSLVTSQALDEVVGAIKAAQKPIILVGGAALYDEGALNNMARLAKAGVRVMIDTFPARQARGAGRFAPEKMQYFAEMAISSMAGVDLMILAGTSIPCAFFAYPNTPSILVPDGCVTLTLSERCEDTIEALQKLVDALGAVEMAAVVTAAQMPAPTGPLNPAKIAQSLSRHMPENTIICDDSVSNGFAMYFGTMGAKKHDWLALTGGAIGIGLSMAIGAQMAAPQRKTIALSGDGSAMYAIQALWTMAREKLPIVTIIFANHDYKVLNIEMMRTGAGDVGATAKSMLSLANPNLDFVALAKGHGVQAASVTTSEEFDEILESALASNEPWLIEAMI
ncbi:MAG: hypothetical protein FD163_802 [Hyphomonadaceae bacterium]|nr:MAG: hypothetical protein FD163_802 [Hyphomonadaceae bacterium]